MLPNAEQHLARLPGDEGGAVGECCDEGQAAAADGEWVGQVGVESGAVGGGTAVADLEQAVVVVDDDGDVDGAVGVGVQHGVGACLGDEHSEMAAHFLIGAGEAQ